MSIANDFNGVTIKLAELLRHPEDLEKIPALKSEILRKKAAVDGQLKLGLKEQLEVTQASMNCMADGQKTVSMIKEEMKKIDKLCAEAQSMIKDFPHINMVSQTHRNFAQVEHMRKNLESFTDRLADLELKLRRDDDNLEEMPNLLAVHFELTKLRDLRDEAIDQIRKASDSSLQATLEDYFNRLDDTIEIFDQHIGMICMNLIPLVQQENNSLVVRLAIILEAEEKSDRKIKAMQNAQRDHKELAARFKSITAGPKALRGYKEKFIGCIKIYAEGQLQDSEQKFLEDPEKLEKAFKWFFNDLYAVKKGMVPLMPKKWRILRVYGDIYHNLMREFLIKLIDDPDLGNPHMLAIIHWGQIYYSKMAKLGFKENDLQPQLIDGREPELVREWRSIIIKRLGEAMDQIYQKDREDFTTRAPNTLEQDEHKYFHTRYLIDTWRLSRQSTEAAGKSDRTDVTEGVVDAMFRLHKTRQTRWWKIIDEEAGKYSTGQGENEGFQSLLDWLAAVANDQIACIDDNEDQGQLGYLSRFRQDYEPLVTPAYLQTSAPELESLRDGYVDLGTHCITTFVQLVFAVDFKGTLAEFFTPKWYEQTGMRRITSTFEDYISDYSHVLHPSMLDIFVEELADALLVRYLLGVRNRGAKLKRADAFSEKIRDDLVVTFAFFAQFADVGSAIKQKWRVVDWFSRLLAADKAGVAEVYVGFKREYWDLQLGWVEAVLKVRDDYERAMLNAVKSQAASLVVAQGPETIMSKVK
ncbi:MAG: SNARE-binding exocyst subunit S6 [Trizodia sp. TS-e1964]|nr:MAG: SNARE-binding exocyst subunit S6 [Trizodia sp. TS-e1964]